MEKIEKVKIYVLSKLRFDDLLKNNNIDDSNVDTYKNSAFICINDTTGSYYHEPILTEHFNVLNLFFDDVETDTCEYRAFTENDAKRVISFLDVNKNVKLLLVHCGAGVSRSGAIGQFALDYLNGDKDQFNFDNSFILPNSRVLQMLIRVLRKKIK